MESYKDKNCTLCKHLSSEEENAPFSARIYYCPAIRNLVHSTRDITMKMDKLDKFYCHAFDRRTK